MIEEVSFRNGLKDYCIDDVALYVYNGILNNIFSRREGLLRMIMTKNYFS